MLWQSWIIWLIITADGMVVMVEVVVMMVDPLPFWKYKKIHKFFHELKHVYILQSVHTCCVVHLFSPTAELQYTETAKPTNRNTWNQSKNGWTTTPFTTEIWTHICSCHNFFLLSFVHILLIPPCCLRWYVKCLYRHLFLEDTSEHARLLKNCTTQIAIRIIPRCFELRTQNLFVAC